MAFPTVSGKSFKIPWFQSRPSSSSYGHPRIWRGKTWCPVGFSHRHPVIWARADTEFPQAVWCGACHPNAQSGHAKPTRLLHFSIFLRNEWGTPSFGFPHHHRYNAARGWELTMGLNHIISTLAIGCYWILLDRMGFHVKSPFLMGRSGPCASLRPRPSTPRRNHALVGDRNTYLGGPYSEGSLI